MTLTCRLLSQPSTGCVMFESITTMASSPKSLTVAIQRYASLALCGTRVSLINTVRETCTLTRSISCENCGVDFEPNTHNQKYCSAECCRIATNRRIMERYYERKRNRSGSERLCRSKGCDTRLSRYNDSRYCSVHTPGKGLSGAQLLGRIGVT